MTREKLPLFISVLFITFGAIANIIRFLWNVPIAIGTVVLPGWTGSLFFLVLGALAAWSFRALRAYDRPPSNPSNP